MTDRRVTLVAVYDPSRGELFHALAEQGAWLNGEPLSRGGVAPPSLSKAIALVDFKRLPAALARRREFALRAALGARGSRQGRTYRLPRR